MYCKNNGGMVLIYPLHCVFPRCSTPILSPLSTAVSPSLVVPTSWPTPPPQTPSCQPTFSLTTSDLRTSAVVRSTLESQPSKTINNLSAPKKKKKNFFPPKKKKKKKKKK